MLKVGELMGILSLLFITTAGKLLLNVKIINVAIYMCVDMCFPFHIMD